MPICSADFIFDGAKFHPNAFLHYTENGEIIKLTNTNESPKETRFFKGIISPGFINCHCHIELSHLIEKIPQKTGLPQFIKTITTQRQTDTYKIKESIKQQIELLQKNGIVAVGDICNTTHTAQAKRKSPIHFHNFIELFGLENTKIAANIAHAKEVAKQLPEPNSITPHAPYSVTPELMETIITENDSNMFTIHNQENKSENTYFQSKKGSLFELMKIFQPALDIKTTPNLTSIQNYGVNFEDKHIIYVHNTFTSQEDIEKIMSTTPDAFWCFCPNANLYIENTLPNFTNFKSHYSSCVIGTDSLASNNKLCILSEVKTLLQKNVFSQQELLTMATFNGAKALKIQNKYGRFLPKMQPGIINISTNSTGSIYSESTLRVIH